LNGPDPQEGERGAEDRSGRGEDQASLRLRILSSSLHTDIQFFGIIMGYFIRPAIYENREPLQPVACSWAFLLQ
jgi:hypothetical protein